MKSPVIFRLGLVLLSFALAPCARAQAPVTLSDPEPGYWNVETNLTARDHTIVRFYNGQHQLVYQERLDGLNLDLRKASRCCRRTKARLSASLEAVLRDPAAARRDDNLLARQFGPDRRVQRLYATR